MKNRHVLLVFLICVSSLVACTSDNSATVPPGGSVPPAGTAQAKVVFARVVGTTTPVGTYAIQEDGTGLTTLLTGSASALLGQAPNGRLVFADNSGAIVSVNPNGSGLVTLAPAITQANGPNYCGVTPNNRVVYRYEYFVGQALNGNVYSRNVDGTGAVNTLADSNANEICEAVHPGGRVILSEFTGTAGLNSARLYSVSEDGTGQPANLFQGGVRFAGIAAGGRLIFVGSNPPNGETIYSANPDGTGVAELQTNGSWYDGGLWIAPSGKVVYVHYFDDGNGGTQVDLLVVNADGTARQRLTNDTLGEDYLAEAPNGRIIFRCGDGLCSIFPNGTGRQTLATGAGSAFVMVTNASRVIYQYLANAIHGVNSDGTAPATVASAGAPNQVALMGISPSGRVIYQFANGSFGTQDDLRSVNADGTGSISLANASNGNEWLMGITTNDRVIFSRNVGSQVDLYSIRADGTGLQALSTTTDDDVYSGIFY
jgi:Tol biopolymer transport system component